MTRVFLSLIAAIVGPLMALAEPVAPNAEPTTAPVSAPAAPAAPTVAPAPAKADLVEKSSAAPAFLKAVEKPKDNSGAKKTVMVIPVRGAIDKPILYVLRRGLKEAIEKKADAVVLDIKTPGGAIGVTLDIMEALEKFEGTKIAYVNREALSAGAFISATNDEIWFAPGGVIGAAAPVTGEGKDMDTTMKQKVVSFLTARVRATTEGKGHRGQVVSAMIDSDYELKIDDKVIKAKGSLLSLTATEASALYGTPPEPLLAAGIAKTVDDLLTQKYGAGNFVTEHLEVTWSEKAAKYLNAISPVLMGLGLLALFIEFKAPGGGVFGVTGGVLLALVFFGHYVAGLSGHEPILFFFLGVALVLVELLFFPGILVAALTGVLLMLGALVWSMADLWPNEPVSFNSDVFTRPLLSMALGLAVAGVLAALLIRFMPRGWFWDKMVLAAAIDTHSQAETTGATGTGNGTTLVGRRGVVVTALVPSGQIEIDGRRYEARTTVGSVEKGVVVIVTRRSDFGLVVERAEA